MTAEILSATTTTTQMKEIWHPWLVRNGVVVTQEGKHKQATAPHRPPPMGESKHIKTAVIYLH